MSDAPVDQGLLVEEDVREFVTLHIADQLFGLAVSEIHDVFPPSGLTPVPLAPPQIAGVLNLRGRIVTAVDARARLGLPPREDAGRPSMAIGIERGGESYGLIIDSVGEVLRLPAHDFESNPCNLDTSWQEVARGVYRLDRGLLIILDIDRMFDIESATVGAA